ncbi:antigen WC1.1-like [Dama dama]
MQNLEKPGNQTQVLPQCSDSLSEVAGFAASEESAPYCSDSRQLRLVDGGGPCAGRVGILEQGSWGTICDDGWDLDDARVVCRQRGCGDALNATGSAHFRAGSGSIWLDDLNCTGKESYVWRVSGPQDGERDQQCAGWLEVFYNGTWGSVCHSPMDDIIVSMICRQLGCGDSGTLSSSVALREGSRPRWVDGIRCRKTDTSFWHCSSDPWNYNSCFPKEEAYITCAGRRPKSCPAAAPCTDREKLRLRGGDSECSGRVEVWHGGSWGTVCDDSWSLAEAEVVCQQLGCGPALEAVRAAVFGPGNGSIWLDEVRCGGRESSLWDCAAEPWGQSDCKHEEDAGVRCSGARTTLPLTTAGTVIHPRAGENTQIPGTCSVGSLTAQENKEPEEPRLVGRSRGITLGNSPALVPRARRFSYPESRDQTSLESSPWHLLPALGLLPHPGGPSLPGPHRPGDSGAQMESRAQRWAAGGTGDQGACVQAGDGAGVRMGAWARSLF